MSVSNGMIQTVVQGCRDETNMPPEFITGTTNDDEAPTLIATSLFVANASLSEEGGDTDSRSDNGLQVGGGQATGGGTEVNEHSHVSPTRSPPLSVVRPRPQQ